MRWPLLTASFLLALPPPASAALDGPGGAMTCDFSVSNELTPDQIAPLIERDRMYMTERPGMVHKHIPLRPDPTTGNLLAGGRYLFGTEAQAQDYLRWVREDFVLDGIHFFDRAYFHDVDCHAWSTIGSVELRDVHDQQVVLRTERWSVPHDSQRPFLKTQWPAIEQAARDRGLSAAWLLYDRQEDLVTVVSFAPRLAGSPDAGLLAIEAAPTLAPTLDARPGYERTFDRSHWTLTVWFPYAFADRGEPSTWPNSPLFPQPSTMDTLCEPSRGETHATAPDDCTPSCGDGVADADESTRTCPSDVRPRW
jgi:hypothetical protein